MILLKKNKCGSYVRGGNMKEKKLQFFYTKRKTRIKKKML